MDQKVYIRRHGHPIFAISQGSISTVEEIPNQFVDTGDYFVLCEGKIAQNEDTVIPGKCYTLCQRVRGGKGGFGSMLRAIGAQIEKTTNREACRDLSGRRMRDVNNEKKMVEYLEKKAEREREREKKKMEKLERLTQQPKHFFNDPDYDTKLREAVENVDNAVEKGIIAHAKKRKSNANVKQKEPKIKKGLWLGEETMSDSDSDSDNDEMDEFKSLSRVENTSQSSSLEPGPSTSSNSSSSSTSQSTSSISVIQTNDSPIPAESLAEGHENSATIESSSAIPSEVTKDQNCETNEIAKANILSSKNSVEDTKLSETNPTVDVNNREKISESDYDSVSNTVENETDPKPLNIDDIDFSKYSTADELESLGLETLKLALLKKGVKCGGSLKERAARLFEVKDLAPDKIDPALLATKSKKRNRSKK